MTRATATIAPASIEHVTADAIVVGELAYVGADWHLIDAVTPFPASAEVALTLVSGRVLMVPARRAFPVRSTL